jgi:pyruvate/2-oxoglutarate dehydrogenase complex dihydrolipoamide dehydrogenase (E3) component
MDKYDAIIIGIGQAGNPLTDLLAEHGLKVAVIEKKYPGGSCINYGCSPTKAMLAAAAVAYEAKHAKHWGIKVEGVQTDFKKIIKRRDDIVKKWRKGIDERIRKQSKADLIYGEASFVSENEIEIKLTEGGTQNITAEKIFINVGTSPQVPEIDGLPDVDYYTARSIMKLKELPEHLVILGGSYIGVEYAQMYRRLGSKVTIIQDSDQLLPREDRDIALAVHEILEKEGIKVLLKAEAQKLKQTTKGLSIKVNVDGAGEQTVKGSHLLIAIGTKPSTEALKLENAGIETDEKGSIEVDNKLETSAKNIWALGDCKGGPEFTHISYDDYRIVRNQLFGDKTRTTDDRPVPYTLYTRPELGRIGLTEAQAKEKKKNFQVVKIEAEEVGRATLEGKEEGLLKVLINKDNDQILGAACLMERGGELAAMIQIAMMGKIPYQKLKDGVFAHPGYAEAWNTLFAKLDD